jgi:hypothetical protein
MLSLAAPVALGELGWMSMSVVDTIMVGGLGPAAIGATGVGGSLFYVFAIFGVGLLFGARRSGGLSSLVRPGAMDRAHSCAAHYVGGTIPAVLLLCLGREPWRLA